MKLSIILPVYNEAPTVTEILERIACVFQGRDVEIIIVDDASCDHTIEKIREFQARKDVKVRLVRHERNSGKGVSVREGFALAQGEAVVIQDADLEYDPADIISLLGPIQNNEADVVYGSRFLGSRYPRGMSFACYVANRLLTWMTNKLYGARLTDMETCYKVLRRNVLAAIKIEAQRFDLEPEITAKILLKKIPIREMPISYHARPASAGKKIKPVDFFVAVWVLWRLRRCR